MRPLTSQFWFTSGATDCQDLLKHEIVTRNPELRLAFSRPGLVTFKAARPLGLDEPPVSALAMLTGLSLGGGKTAREVAQRIAELSERAPRGSLARFRVAHRGGRGACATS